MKKTQYDNEAEEEVGLELPPPMKPINDIQQRYDEG